MTYQDKSIQCSDCSATFTFGAEEQEQFAAKGYTNSPKRCPTCRAARKAQQNVGNNSFNNGSSFNGSNSYNNSSYAARGYSSAPRTMFAIKCATCGKDAQVPFEPRGDKPVYCSDCYRKTNPVKRTSY
jgi:CxxC-x17-CxxC domain-containing protein